MFYFETFRIIFSLKKVKQPQAMSAIQNQKALWRKKSQCDEKDVKSKTKTTSYVKSAESTSRTNSYAENAKTKPT